MDISREIEAILSRGYSLHNAGVYNWALSREQALMALDELQSHDVPVLGGDVFELVDGNPEPNYDSWYCDRNSSESLSDYIPRSIDQARNYVKRYRNPTGRDTLFVLVVE